VMARWELTQNSIYLLSWLIFNQQGSVVERAGHAIYPTNHYLADKCVDKTNYVVY